MRNKSKYNDQFILGLIKQVNGNPYTCTAFEQYAVVGNHIVPVLMICQDDVDADEAILFCERTEAVDFCDGNMTIGDLFAMVYYYEKISFQKNVNDIEYEDECKEYEAALQKQYSWYKTA